MRKFLFICSLLILFTACSSSKIQKPTTKTTGFLPNYSSLKLSSNPNESIQLYRYLNPQIKSSDYRQVIIESVILYQIADSKSNPDSLVYLNYGASPQVIEQTRTFLETYLHDIIKEKFPLTDKPGPGVARLTVAITGAEISKDGMKVINVIPISAAIRLTSIAANLDTKKAVLVIEAKVSDSQSGVLLGSAFAIISGDKFRRGTRTREEFQNLAKSWVQAAVKYASGFDKESSIQTVH